MRAEDIHRKLKEKFGEVISELYTENCDDFCRVEDCSRLEEVCLFLRDAPEMRFNFLACLSGVDYKEHYVVVYHLLSYIHGHSFVIKVKVPGKNPVVPTVEKVWSTANWFERETFDLLGIEFSGHSDLRRILLPDDWPGHPLRKDWVEPNKYRGISTQREDLLEQLVKIDQAKASQESETEVKT